MGERKPYEPETISLAGRIAPDDKHDRCCCRPWHFQSRSVQTRPQCRFPGVSDRQTHRCLAGKLPRLAGPAVHRTKMRLSAKKYSLFHCACGSCVSYRKRRNLHEQKASQRRRQHPQTERWTLGGADIPPGMTRTEGHHEKCSRKNAGRSQRKAENSDRRKPEA